MDSAVQLTNVGTLEPYLKKAVRYRHPETGKLLKSMPRRHVRFILSVGLKQALHEV
jgi:nucleoid DNA-binding protein